MLREFRRRAHLYESNLPEHGRVVEWLALMQHHGCVTRLLDFTWSFYIACYFAVARSAEEACVWAISDSWLQKSSTEYCESLGLDSGHISLRDDTMDFALSGANTLLNRIYPEYKARVDSDGIEPGILLVEPLRQIKRLAVQQGVFLMPTDVSVSFWDNLDRCGPLAETYEFKDGRTYTAHRVKKIEMSNSFVQSAQMHLRTMNITAESLFPGLEGLARSMTDEWGY